MSKQETLTGIAIGTGIGLLTGIVLGLLYAPKSGKELRQDIQHKADDVSASVRARLGKGRLEDVKP